MKRTIFLAGASAFILLAGCGTTGKVTTQVGDSQVTVETQNQTNKNAGANNVATNARRKVILEWSGQENGEPAVPAWLKTMRHGNGTAYCAEYGLTETATRKFITPSCAMDVNLDNALNTAQAEVALAVGEEMLMDINSVVSSKLTDGQRENLRSVVIKSITSVSGLKHEGDFWQLIQRTDSHGNTTETYYAYVFYSMRPRDYNTQLNACLINILKSQGVDPEVVDAVKAGANEIVEKSQRQDAAAEAAKERAQQLALADYQTKQAEAASTAIVAASDAVSSISPALAELLSQ